MYTFLIIKNYFVSNQCRCIFSYIEDPKIKKHTQSMANSRLYQFTPHNDSMFQAYDFHLISTKIICTDNQRQPYRVICKCANIL